MAALAWAALSAVVFVAGFVATLFDPQYDADTGLGRIGSCILVGQYAAGIYSFATLPLAGLIGVVAELTLRRRAN